MSFSALLCLHLLPGVSVVVLYPAYILHFVAMDVLGVLRVLPLVLLLPCGCSRQARCGRLLLVAFLVVVPWRLGCRDWPCVRANFPFPARCSLGVVCACVLSPLAYS